MLLDLKIKYSLSETSIMNILVLIWLYKRDENDFVFIELKKANLNNAKDIYNKSKKSCRSD